MLFPALINVPSLPSHQGNAPQENVQEERAILPSLCRQPSPPPKRSPVKPQSGLALPADIEEQGYISSSWKKYVTVREQNDEGN
jgi:hypothetical protein